MVHLPEGVNGRDAHNGSCFGDARVVWEIEVEMVLAVVQSIAGTGEVHKTGETVVENRTYHFLAPTGALAIAAYENRFGYMIKDRKAKIISTKALVKIDAEIAVTNH